MSLPIIAHLVTVTELLLHVRYLLGDIQTDNNLSVTQYKELLKWSKLLILIIIYIYYNNL